MYNNYPQVPVYDSSISYVQPTYANQYGQVPYANNAYATQQSQPVYQTSMSQMSTNSIYTPQQPIYESAPQQPPPSYASAIQSPPSQTYDQPQQSVNNTGPEKPPFSPGFKWPHNSIHLICPKCGATVSTRVDREITIITIIGAIILLFFGCILVCLPFCIPACKKTIHYCPYCNSQLGVRSELR